MHASSIFSFFVLLISIAATPVAAQNEPRVDVAREITIVAAVTISVTIVVAILICVCAHCGPNLIMRAWRLKPKPKEAIEHDPLEV
ncbi:hypothetical protein DL771_003956 [Monosporascus sp. 5C6A]|nr:hypothetical protein DL771_003956 [Monosporascus sp. 5C6A]